MSNEEVIARTIAGSLGYDWDTLAGPSGSGFNQEDFLNAARAVLEILEGNNDPASS